ncbi:MAG: Flp pilus assembly complex ATPase component TadA, partial [Planctomycetes bacterium]|nr:Flp pilus assembly complex ATPase component TadA [Planctomycetota bacterium]
INKAYEKDREMGDVLEGLEFEGDLESLAEDLEGTADLLDVAQQAPIIKLVNSVLHQALRKRASDIHIQPLEDSLKIRLRIDGNLYDYLDPPKKIQDAIISRVKVMGKMDIAERRIPQDGRATIRVGDREVDLRISIVPTAFGERVVFRLLDKGAKLFSLPEVGLADKALELVNTFINFNHGIILVTGPTGSGKTTTLYAALSTINAPDINIMTIEDPIEYHLRGISQMQILPKKGLTFAAGLRSLLRQDPDVMMVGEIRDEETARIAIQAALTGHLVFSTIHTNDAPSSVTRMLDIGVEPYLVSSSVICVIAQRLVRRICENCKTEYEATLDEVADLGIDPDAIPGGVLHKGAGCEKCMDTGYWGRVAIFEVLPITERVRQFIMQRNGASEIKRHAVETGLMRTLRMDGAAKVLRGETTVEEVLSVTQMDIY